MAKDINLTSKRWNDIVFDGKPQDYGAYEMRRTSSRRHVIAFIFIVLLVTLVALLPVLIETVAKFRPAAENISEDTTLADLKTIEEVEKQNEIAQQVAAEPPPPLKSTIQFVAPEIVNDEDIKDDEMIKTQEELQQSTAQVSLFDVEGTDEELGVDKAELEVHQAAAEEVDNKVYDFVQQMPQFPGGNEELLKFLGTNIKYPSIAAENGVEGTVVVRFTVMSDGSISNVNVLSGPDSSLNNEAVRVVKTMPRWIPGKQNGRAVNVNYTVPVRFVLKR